MLPYGAGQLIEANLTPGVANERRPTVREFTMLYIQEAEAMLPVVDKSCSSGYTLVNPQDQHTVMRNLGCTGLMTYTLPSATPAGQRYGPFYNASTGGIKIYPSTGELFTKTFMTTESTGYIGSVTPTDLTANLGLLSLAATSGLGTYIAFNCYSTGKWTASMKVGTFTSST